MIGSNGKTGRPPGGDSGDADVDFEIDVGRIVWDPEYRASVLAEFRRRNRGATDGPDGVGVWRRK